MWHPAGIITFLVGEQRILTRPSWKLLLPKRKPAHIRKGLKAEMKAARFLQAHGLTIIARNFHLPAAEIDIIARDGAVHVFVEVKFRADDAIQNPEQIVDAAQVRHIKMAARQYLNTLPGQIKGRLDIIVIQKKKAYSRPVIHWIRGWKKF